MWNCDSSTLNQYIASVSSASVSSQDTISVHSDDFRPSWTDTIQMNLRHVSEWPSPFSIPKFSHDVELKWCKANVTYEKSKKGLAVTRDMKMEILEKIAEAVFEIKAYPEKDELETVASALVLKYPCLQEPGSITGYEGWKASIKHKLGNYRSKLRRAGCNEVNVNRNRKGEDEASCPFTLKKPRCGEVNHIPDYPQHHDEARDALVSEMKKKQKNLKVIQQKMALTLQYSICWCNAFAKFIIPCATTPLNALANVTLKSIFEELHQITSKDLLGTFNAPLDKFVPGLLKLYWSNGAVTPNAIEAARASGSHTSDIVSHRKTAALRGLPIFLKEDATQVFLKYLCSSLQGRENHVKKLYALSLLRDSSWERWPQCHNSHLEVKVDVRETLPEMFYEICCLFTYTKHYLLHSDHITQTSCFLQSLINNIFRNKHQQPGSSSTSHSPSSFTSRLMLFKS
ncbi:unnamed protein product [Oreochromis niloticus]|nr:unnamed protein product [Mustela putorius furo]